VNLNKRIDQNRNINLTTLELKQDYYEYLGENFVYLHLKLQRNSRLSHYVFDCSAGIGF